MTTLAWDGKYLYADSQVTQDDRKSTMTKALRVKTPEGFAYLAVAGEISVLYSVVTALQAGEPIEPLVNGNSTVLVIKNGVATVTSGKKSFTDTAPLFLGSGSDIAHGAYHVSKSVAKAVAAACAIDLYSSGPIVRIRTA